MAGTKSKICVTIIATLTAILFIVLAYIYKEHATLFLSVEVILLPSIYIIGNAIAEKLIKDEYEGLLDIFNEQASILNERNFKLTIMNEKLKYEIKLLKKNGKKS